MPDDVIQQIGKVTDQQIKKGSPVTVLHLTEEDWLAVKAHKERFPAVAAASGEPTADDQRPRYLQIPVARSFREFSFAEFIESEGGRVTPAWVRIDTPNITVHQSSSILGGVRFTDAEELEQANLYRAGMMARSGSNQGSLLGQPPDTSGRSSGTPLPLQDEAARVDVLADADGEPITDSEGNTIGVGVAENAAATDHISAEVLRRPPPEIPATKPAALDFTLRGGRIALATDAAATDVDDATVAAMFGMVHLAADELAGALRATNADGRLVGRLERVRETAGVPAPTLATAFRLGHEADVLRIYLVRADPNELDPDSAAAVKALAGRLDDCVAQYPAWRIFKRNARAAELTREQIAAAPLVATALVAEMETTDGQQVVHPGVPSAFKDLVTTFDLIATPDDPTGAIKVGCDLLAADLVENLGNFVKVATSFAADVYCRRYFKGFQRSWGDLAEADGEKMAIWLHTALKAAFVGGPLAALGVGGAATLWQVLAVTYPDVFHPLAAAWDFIQAWGPFVADGLR